MIAAVVLLGVLNVALLAAFVFVVRAGARMIGDSSDRAADAANEGARARAASEKAYAEERLRLIGEHREFLADHLRAEAADRARLLERIQTPPSWPLLPDLPSAEAAPADFEVDEKYAATGAGRLPWDVDLAPLPGDPDHEETP